MHKAVRMSLSLLGPRSKSFTECPLARVLSTSSSDCVPMSERACLLLGLPLTKDDSAAKRGDASSHYYRGKMKPKERPFFYRMWFFCFLRSVSFGCRTASVKSALPVAELVPEPCNPLDCGSQRYIAHLLVIVPRPSSHIFHRSS